MKMLFIATMFAVASGGVLAEGAGSSSKGGSKFEKNGKPSQSWSQPFKPVAFGKNDKDTKNDDKYGKNKNDDKYGKDKDDKHYGRDDDRGHGRPDWAHHIRDDDHKPWHHHHKPPISHC
jgi:hypothetical protein